MSSSSTFVPIVLEEDLKPAAQSSKDGSLKKIAIIAALFAGGILFAFLFNFQDPIVAQVAVLAPSMGNSALHQKIYECYNTQTMSKGAGGELHFVTPARISILEVTQKGEVDPRCEGTPYYARVMVRLEDGTTYESDAWAFFVKKDGTVWYESWGGLAWRNFMLDAAEDKLPPIRRGKLVTP